MRLAAMVVAAAAAMAFVPVIPAAAVEQPQVVVGSTPLDDPPGPELSTKQNRGCLGAGVLHDSDLSQPPPPELALDLRHARALSNGAGVTVAVIDTGVTPNLRLPNLIGGGDYVVPGGDGLSDCDAHGTLIAGIIGAASDPGDAFAGVAPAARIISIRSRSDAFDFERPASFDSAQQSAMDVRTLARAITHAANQGAGVIVISLPICVTTTAAVDQSMLAVAIGYAVRTRGAVVVAGAGNTGDPGCQQNPDIDPTKPADPRNWDGVKTVSTPSWFASDVVSVGFTTATGAEVPDSLTGPWVSVAAPGTGIESLGPGGGLINGIGASGSLVPVGGSSFAAAYAAGVAALLRSRFPAETPGEIVNRLRASAHAPARGVDNAVGAGSIDPMAALSYRTPPQLPAGLGSPRTLAMAAPPPSKDARPGTYALIIIALAGALALCVVGAEEILRRRE
ncbi:type VII secretion-associated serine protease mycosin [Nocardia sp. CDC160]|uniref:type VII secretion-associated serine protease mycosin n=1 Tax=Nocardia sp. CDC160 TaxID=3112166 RepID=UPI002DBAFA2D|nr:type VII secretion-associated serine protease mycosin [Nocardia sp. CDC160]MEC3920220.1 type VII secretion-associated serine protease mycosin [Nocardia sp. CDC160]